MASKEDTGTQRRPFPGYTDLQTGGDSLLFADVLSTILREATYLNLLIFIKSATNVVDRNLILKYMIFL